MFRPAWIVAALANLHDFHRSGLMHLLVMVMLAWGNLASAAEPPNILLLISDDHRWDCLGVAGNRVVQSPRLDRLAAEGCYAPQFTLHVSQCSPCRAMLLTGLPPHRNRWYSNQYQDPAVVAPDGFKDLLLLPELIRKAGYQTVLTGKWHLAAEPWNCGFSQVRTWLPGGSGPYRDTRLAQGNSRNVETSDGYLQQVLADDVIAFLKSDQARRQPFFHWVAFTAPHAPYQPNPPHIQKLYAGKPVRDLLPPGFPPDLPTGNWQQYYEAISYLDEQVGRILDTLAETRLAERTIVVFMGDNGYMMGTKGVGTKGGTGKVVPYEESIRAPFMMRGPGIVAGLRDAAVSSLDLPPTLLRLAGGTLPASWPGRDLGPLLRGEKAHGIDHAISEWADNQSKTFGHLAYRLVRTPTHKLIVWEKADRPDELYDLKADPREDHNRANDRALAKVRADLRRRLDAWMEQTADPARNWKK